MVKSVSQDTTSDTLRNRRLLPEIRAKRRYLEVRQKNVDEKSLESHLIHRDNA